MERIVAALKPMFDEINSKLDALHGTDRRLAVQVAMLTGDVSEIKENMATKSDLGKLRSDVFDKIDSFLPVVKRSQTQLEDNDKSFWKHQDRLDDHESRLKKLEGKS